MALALAATAALTAPVPRPAPDLAIQKPALQLRGYRGKIVVLTFISTT
jgi:hypothetical protein